MKYIPLILCLLQGCLLCSCSDDTSAEIPYIPRQATVTLMVTHNNLGDNGYNDCAAEGVIAFAEETGTPLRFLQPTDEADASRLYHRWLEEYADRDSAVLIVGNSAYESLLKEHPPVLTGQGSRVLLFESDSEIEGVSTVMIQRYGVSYLAAALSEDFDALILAAAPGFPTLEASIRGFQDGREAHAGEYNGFPCTTELHYLAKGEEGFSMPDSAYRFIAQRAAENFSYDEMIFPLLGGSQSGVLHRLNDDEFSFALMVGMDTDLTGLSTRIPFSVEIRIGTILKDMLHNWQNGEAWPRIYAPGMEAGATDIVVNTSFHENLILWDERYEEPGTFQLRYDKYKNEAIRKEKEHES